MLIGKQAAQAEGLKRELYCESHGVRVGLSNLQTHPYPCILRVGYRVRCVTHDKTVDLGEVEKGHATCTINMRGEEKARGLVG